MSNRVAWGIALTLVVAAVAAVACITGGAHPGAVRGRPMADGDTIGEPVRRAGVQGTPTGVRTLLAAGCQDGTLIVRTNVEKIIAPLDCSKSEPAARYEPFLEKVIAITYTNGRLRFENPTAVTLEVPVKAPKVYGSDATP